MGRARSPAAGESFAACLGAVLRRLRSLRHLSQDELGRLAGYDGSYVGAVERAAVRPSRALIAALDRALDAAGGLLAVWRLADQEWDARAALGAAGDPWPLDPSGPAPAGVVRSAPGPVGGAPGGVAVAGPGAAMAPDEAATAAAGSRPDAVVEAMELARLAEASGPGEAREPVTPA
jgi:transcriptional regulator with XRE-family HTH domain